jgi:hypothetical protein
MSSIKTICVFCGSGYGGKQEIIDATRELSNAMIRKEMALVFGGGNDGLMKALADVFMEHKKTVIGVIPQEYVDKNREYPNMTELITTKDMAERTNVMIEKSDGFIILPGGYGTVNELFTVLYSSRMGKITKPCAVLNVSSFYDYLIKFLDESVKNGLLGKTPRKVLFSSDNPNTILEYFENYEPIVIESKWV